MHSHSIPYALLFSTALFNTLHSAPHFVKRVSKVKSDHDHTVDGHTVNICQSFDPSWRECAAFSPKNAKECKRNVRSHQEQPEAIRSHSSPHKIPRYNLQQKPAQSAQWNNFSLAHSNSSNRVLLMFMSILNSISVKIRNRKQRLG